MQKVKISFFFVVSEQALNPVTKLQDKARVSPIKTNAPFLWPFSVRANGCQIFLISTLDLPLPDKCFIVSLKKKKKQSC